jgi:hypothetical protein
VSLIIGAVAGAGRAPGGEPGPSSGQKAVSLSACLDFLGSQLRKRGLWSSQDLLCGAPPLRRSTECSILVPFSVRFDNDYCPLLTRTSRPPGRE